VEVDTSLMSPSRARAAVQRTTGRIIRQMSSAIAVIAFSPFEEEFFREGDKLSQATGEKHDFSDLDHGFHRPTLWRSVIRWLRGERTPHSE
jgi:hypothetical protein